MEDTYALNRTVKALFKRIVAGSTEAPVQAHMDAMLLAAFPFDDGYFTFVKHKEEASNKEPDNRVARVLQDENFKDILYVENKRLAEKTSLKAFDKVANHQLSAYMSESLNGSGALVDGAVRIGCHIKFYTKIIPNGAMERDDYPALHVVDDAKYIQDMFNYLKGSGPATQAYASASTTAPSSSSVAYVAPYAYASSSTTAPSSSAAPSTAPYTHASSSTTSANAPRIDLPDTYYMVKKERYFYVKDGVRTLVDRPFDVWVYHEQGWSATGRTQKWRKEYEKNQYTYED